MLKNPIAKGVHRISVTKKGGIHKWIENSVPTIVSEETWNQAQVVLKQAPEQARIPVQDVFIGKIHCECEKPMEIVYKSQHYSCHRCKTQVPIDDVHAIFEKAMEDIPFPDQESLDAVADTNDLSTDQSLRSQINKLETENEKLFELYTSDAITIDIFKARHEKISSQIEQLQNTLTSQEEKPRPTYNFLYDFWSSTNSKTRQLLLDIVVDKITFSSNVAVLYLYPLFNFVQHGTETPSNGANLNIEQNT